MIIQTLMNFGRDVLLSWVSGMGSLLGGVDVGSAGAAIGGVAGQAGHFLALFISNAVWPAILAAWGIWLAVWLGTGLFAIFARRGTSS